MSLDTTVKESGAGSLEVTIPFDNDGEVNVGQGAWFGNFDNTSAYNSDIVYDGTQFTNIIFDILIKNTVTNKVPTVTMGLFGWVLWTKALPVAQEAPAKLPFPRPPAIHGLGVGDTCR